MSAARNYPQPHEDVAGADRTEDDLLSLEDTAIPRRLLMMDMVNCLRKATLVGNPAPIVARMSERMRKPQPGDLVMEESTAYRRDEDTRIKAFGILVAHRQEWWQTDQEWAAQVEQDRRAHQEFLSSGYAQPGDEFEPWEPDERGTDDAWYVQYGPEAGDICRWVNCSFVAIPTDPRAFDVPVGTRDGNGVTFNRDDIVGALADSGFSLKAQ